jgi:mannitol/fructose-specific phosphotransferase system IIA component (Ntr-type)
MNTMADYTEPSLMLPLLRSHDAAAVTAELCSTLQREGWISDLLPFYHAVISHEAVSATVISPGWALPHARSPGIRRLSFALGRTAEPLVWFGGEPVNMIFLFAVPESDAGAYLRLIAGLAKLGQDRWRLQRLADASDSRTMFEVLREVSLPKRPAAVANAWLTES